MAVNIDGNGLIALGGTASTQGRVRLAEDTDNGTNYIELTAPASVASDRTITFPDATTTVVGTDTTQTLTNKSIVATQLTGDVDAARITTALNATGSAPIFATRVWVDFNGTGTVAIRGSGNVSSITDNGTGDYTVNFTDSLPDANYAVSGSFGNDSSVFLRRSSTSPGTSSSALRYLSLSDAGSATDYAVENIIIVR